MISKEKIDEAVKRIVENVHPDKIILFGSYAYGKPDKDSDIDILVIKNMDIPRHKRSREIKKYLRGLKIPIDIIVYSQDEIEEWKDTKHAFINEVMEQGKVLYG